MTLLSSRQLAVVSLAVIGLTGLTVACSSADKKPDPKPDTPVTAKTLPDSLEAAIASEFRTPVNRQRDIYRHPLETLNFFGLKKDMTVVEISPAAGWYTEILAPYLAKNGHYIAAFSHGKSAESATYWQKLNTWVQANPPMATTIAFTNFAPADKTDVAPSESADLLLTFRNVHNWIPRHTEADAFASFYRALKHGGILGVVEHRAKAKGKDKPESGYVSEKRVIDLAKKAGFRLLAKSEINANPADTKDYPEGVWTLPPNFKLGEKDHDKYAAIGESDRMTLKFVKP